MMKLRPRTILARTVEIVASHMDFTGRFWVSSDTWIPSPSDNASAKAIVSKPARIIPFVLDVEYRPMSKPRLVITPEVVP